ncbi:hypothetical protein ACSSS7_005700 [Eimeria intestinalis]
MVGSRLRAEKRVKTSTTTSSQRPPQRTTAEPPPRAAAYWTAQEVLRWFARAQNGEPSLEGSLQVLRVSEVLGAVERHSLPCGFRQAPHTDHWKSGFVRAHSWVVTRKLSGDGHLSDSGSENLVVCEGSSDEAPGESDPHSAQAPLEPPIPKKAKVEAGGGLSGAQSAVEEESTSGSDDERPSTSAGRKRKRKAGAPFSETVVAGEPESPARSEGELEAASALLSLQHSLAVASEPSMVAGEPSPASVPSDVAVQVPATSVGASQMPAPTLVQLLLRPVKNPLPSASALLPTDPSAPSSAAALSAEGAGAAAASTSSATSSEGQQPSTSFAAGSDASPPERRVHPYYRTPTVDPMHLTVRRFRSDWAADNAFAFTRLCSQLQKMRGHLVRDTLGPTQLDQLAQVTLEVVSYMYHYERASTKSAPPSHAARDVGRRYMELDMIVAALQVLGEPASGDWWDSIMSVIPDDTLAEPMYAPLHDTAAARFHANLLRRLHAAVRTLKRGVRLSEQETITLKRDLFCSRYSPSNFKTSRWDAWRADDRDFAEDS